MASSVIPPADTTVLHENYRSCPLYQLPEELVLGVCKHLEGSDVYIMRQTCAKLRRILSSPDLVKRTTWTSRSPARISIRYFSLPQLPTDWGDVLERLRRGPRCLSCTNIRVVAPPGGQPVYDRVMSRMLNNVKWCRYCRENHPLILFPHSERDVPDDQAVCILRQGSITVCPHFALSIANVHEMLKSSVSTRGKETLLFQCQRCSSGMSDAIPPSVTWIRCKLPWHSWGRVKIHWELPLKLDKKEFFYVKRSMHRGLDGISAVQAVRKALSRAAEDHSHLLCPHRSFDDGRLLDMFKRAYPYKSKLLPINVHQLRVEHHTERRLLATDYPDSLLRTPKTRGTICERCNPSKSSWGHQTTWRWTLGDRQDDRLYLERTLHLFIPNLRAYSPSEFDDWTQMLPPPSYGLPEDEELRHITWCPDKTCCNGKSWDNHFRILRNVWHWATEEPVPPPKAMLAVRTIDVAARRVEDPCRLFKSLPKPEQTSLMSRVSRLLL